MKSIFSLRACIDPVLGKTIILAILLALAVRAGAAPIPMEIERFDGSHHSFKNEVGTASISGPMSVRLIPATPPGPNDQVIDLEYFCVGGVPAFAALPGPPFQAATSRVLPAMGHSEAWTHYTAPLAPAGKPLSSGWKEIRFDFQRQCQTCSPLGKRLQFA